MIKEPDGELIGQIIIGNKLKNEENMEEEKIIKLSKDYQILSKKTSLFAVAENEENNKVGEMKQITKKEKKGLFDVFMANNMNNMNYNIDIGSQLNNNNVNYMKDIKMELNNNNNRMNMNMFNNMNMNMMMASAPKMYNNNMEFNSLNYNNNYSRPMRSMAAMEAAPNNKSDDSDEDDYKYNKLNAYEDEPKEMAINAMGDLEEANYDLIKNDLNIEAEGDMFEQKEEMPLEVEYKKAKIEDNKKEEKKIEFSNKELVLTQDIFDGCWNLNPQTKLLIEKEKNIYEKIENIMKEKKIEKEEVKITLLVLYYLNTDTSINKVEYLLIIKKAIFFLEENGIKFDEILPTLKN